MKQNEPSVKTAELRRRVEVVGVGHHRAQVLLDQLRVLPDRLGERAEDDPDLLQLLLEGGGDAHAVEDRVHGHAREAGALVQGHPELLVGLEELRVDIGQALGPVLLDLGGRVVGDGLEVDLRVADVGPLRLAHGEPVPERLEPPFRQERRLLLLRGDEADDVLVQARRDRLGLDVGDEPGLVVAAGQLGDGIGAAHECFRAPQAPTLVNLDEKVNIQSCHSSRSRPMTRVSQ